MRVLGVNAVFHDPSAAIVVDGRIVAAAEEERFNRRKHGKPCVPFSTWELPERAIAFCLEAAGLRARDLDAIAYSYDPALARDTGSDLTAFDYEGLRTYYVRRFPQFLATLLPDVDPSRIRFVPHHVAHAASAYGCAPFDDCAVLVMDGRGETTSALAGVVADGVLTTLETVALPHSLGLRYEDLTAHLGFHRSSDEYKVMGMAGYGKPRFEPHLREMMYARGLGFVAPPIDFARFAPPRASGEAYIDSAHADLAASVQLRLQETILDIARELHARTGADSLAVAGGVALNCVANSYVFERGPFEHVWVQPAAGDAGTSLGAALYVARALGDRCEPMSSAALGRGWDAGELAEHLRVAALDFDEPAALAESVAGILADNGLVAWFSGRSEFGPRALGQRSLLAHPGYAENTQRLNDVKGREAFRPVAPMVLAERAPEIFEGGPLPSPFMLFTHRVREPWRARLRAVTHVDGTARVQTVDAATQPLLAELLRAFERRTGLPVLVNTSLNTAGRPMVDEPRDALECFGSTPIDALVLAPYLLQRERRGASIARDETAASAR